MAIVAMADAVPGAIASSSEYNKLIDNIQDLDSRITAGSWKAGSNPGSNRTLTASEVMGDTHTFSAVAGVRYEIAISTRFSLNTNGVMLCNLRLASGASVTTASGLLRDFIPTGSGANNEFSGFYVWTATGTGTFTFGFGCAAAAGASSGTVNSGRSIKCVALG